MTGRFPIGCGAAGDVEGGDVEGGGVEGGGVALVAAVVLVLGAGREVAVRIRAPVGRTRRWVAPLTGVGDRCARAADDVVGASR